MYIFGKKQNAENNFFVPRATIKNVKCKAQSKIFFLRFIYLRESMCEKAWGKGRGRRREKILSRLLLSQCRAQCGARSRDSGIVA